MRLTRRGYTVLETIIALSVGALVIGLGATIGFRHQRFHRDVAIAVDRTEQLDQAAALAPIVLRAIAPGEGDIAPGSARDTSLEFRATIASAVVCDGAGAMAFLAPVVPTPRLASTLTRPESGDTAWFLDAASANDGWVARPIAGTLDSVGVCRVGGAAPFGTALRRSIALRLVNPAPAGSSVLRITRPWRYSLYKAADGTWYLGAKEWNPALTRFNTIQPVAGPLSSASAGGLRFRYLDSLGGSLGAVPVDVRQVAAIEVSLRVDSALPGKYVHATSVRGRATTLVALRNRMR